jgi:hypothetical protein
MLYGYYSEKRKAFLQRKESYQSLPSARFARVNGLAVTSESAEDPIQIRVLLNDLTPKTIGIFSKKPLKTGTEVELALELTQTFYLRGLVKSSTVYNTNLRVISVDFFQYRSLIEIIFESTAEKQLIDQFCRRLSIQEVVKKSVFFPALTHKRSLFE